VRIDVPQVLRKIRVPPLLLQPIVENAVKHGIAPMRRGGDVTVTARIDTAEPRTLVLVVKDTGAGATPRQLEAGARRRCRLSNIERRLACQYGAAATLSVTTEPGAGMTVEIRDAGRHHTCRNLDAHAERLVNARLRVVIADDERPARSFLAALLRSFEDVVIVAERKLARRRWRRSSASGPTSPCSTCRCPSSTASGSSAC